MRLCAAERIAYARRSILAVEPQRPSPNLVAQMMQQSIAEANIGITHAEFTAGAQSGIMGFKCFELAESTQNQYALQSLIERPDVFNRAISEQRIMILRK